MAITPDINYWAVLVSAIVSMIIGMIWYNPSVFGSIWMKGIGKNEKDMQKDKEKGMAWRYIFALISSLVMSFILAHVVDYTEAVSIGRGLEAGFWIWLGFIATTMTGMVLWEVKPWKVYFINAGFYLVSLIIQGSILAVWT